MFYVYAGVLPTPDLIPAAAGSAAATHQADSGAWVMCSHICFMLLADNHLKIKRWLSASLWKDVYIIFDVNGHFCFLHFSYFITYFFWKVLCVMLN